MLSSTDSLCIKTLIASRSRRVNHSHRRSCKARRAQYQQHLEASERSALYHATLPYSAMTTLLYSTPRHSTLLYSTLLYSTLLYSAVCFALLYSTVLYSTLFYLTLLYSSLFYTTYHLNLYMLLRLQYKNAMFYLSLPTRLSRINLHIIKNCLKLYTYAKNDNPEQNVKYPYYITFTPQILPSS